MDTTTYMTNCLKTEQVLTGSLERYESNLPQVLKLIAAVGQLADMVKREIFYGKQTDDATQLAFQKKLTEIAELVGDRTPQEYTLEPETYRLLHSIIGHATETGELAESGLKLLAGNYDADLLLNIKEELGDCSWYTSIGIDALGTTWDDVLSANIRKLAVRFPNQEFSFNAVMNRDLEAELQALSS